MATRKRNKLLIGYARVSKLDQQHFAKKELLITSYKPTYVNLAASPSVEIWRVAVRRSATGFIGVAKHHAKISGKYLDEVMIERPIRVCREWVWITFFHWSKKEAAYLSASIRRIRQCSFRISPREQGTTGWTLPAEPLAGIAHLLFSVYKSEAVNTYFNVLSSDLDAPHSTRLDD